MMRKISHSMDTIIPPLSSVLRGEGVNGDTGGFAPHEYPYALRGFLA
jgi:hypothetical protein